MGGGGKVMDTLKWVSPTTWIQAAGAKALTGGGGSGDPAASPNQYETTLANIAQNTYSQTDPLRQALLGQMGNFMSGGYDPQKSPLYAAARSGPEAQYKVAKDNVLGSTPRGGGQLGALANLESARASDVGGIPGDISAKLIEDMMSKSYGVAFGAPQQSMSGLSSVAGTFGNRQSMAQAAAQQQQNALYSGLGQMGGMAIGSMLGGPIVGAAGGSVGGKAGSSLGGKK